MANASILESSQLQSRGTRRGPSAANLVAPRRVRGFTLIEMLITVAIVAILAAVALPSYIDYVTRSKIVEATSGLSDMRVRLEQYFLDNRQYPTACVASAAGPAPASKIYLPASIKYFTFSCALDGNDVHGHRDRQQRRRHVRLRLHDRPGATIARRRVCPAVGLVPAQRAPAGSPRKAVIAEMDRRSSHSRLHDPRTDDRVRRSRRCC